LPASCGSESGFHFSPKDVLRAEIASHVAKSLKDKSVGATRVAEIYFSVLAVLALPFSVNGSWFMMQAELCLIIGRFSTLLEAKSKLTMPKL
jgi:hypothetical protein